jgi:hypothetical protein
MNYKNVKANICKKSISNKISPFFSHGTTFYKETRGIGGGGGGGGGGRVISCLWEET